ncbi:type VI secretion system-associated protein TagF [Polymorphobacter multimanifer]|nr:type VI secretion system-associated protein TagF [Polymorphobacter multimanifer]
MLAAGLFGKLPAHGDFVWRGWPETLVADLDRWMTDGVASLRVRNGDEGFAARMTAAPLWHCWLVLQPHMALHGVITPTVDRAGRLFLLVAGVAGPPDMVWAAATQHPGFAAGVEAAVYQALSGELDADGLALELAAAAPRIEAVGRFLASLSCPVASAFWVPNPAAGPPVALPGMALDADTLTWLVEGAVRDAA